MILLKFKTVQTVTISENNQMKCSCSYYCVWGFPYVYMICVSLNFPDSWVGITYNDISVFL